MKYKKLMKIISIAFLSLMIILIPTPVKAAENVYDSWKTEAIHYPDKGQLVPAGEILVQFETLDEGDLDIEGYDIYLDGQLVDHIQHENHTTIQCSVYTTEVSAHQVQVVAITKDKEKIHSSIRTFLVSKKGMGLDVHAKMDDMNLSWYYNWSTTPNKNMNQDIEFVPLVYSDYPGAKEWLKNKSYQYTTVLGFNEPDRTDQANMSVAQAVAFQKNFTDSGLRIGAPAMSYDPSHHNWFIDYANQVNMDEIDYIPIHVYYDWGGEGMADAFLKVVDDTYEKYHKPIWITEYGLANAGLYGANANYADANQQITQFMKDTIAGLEARSYVERYAWFSYGTNDPNGGKTALYNQDTGKLTQLGQLYSELGNPDIKNIDFEDQYVNDQISTPNKPSDDNNKPSDGNHETEKPGASIIGNGASDSIDNPIVNTPIDTSTNIQVVPVQEQIIEIEEIYITEVQTIFEDHVQDVAHQDTSDTSTTDSEKTTLEDHETETVQDSETPLAKQEGHWSIMNLIGTEITVLFAVALLFVKHSQNEEKATRQKRLLLQILGLTIAAISVLITILTVDFSLSMIIADRWTILIVVLAIINMSLFIQGYLLKNKQNQMQVA